jgi:DNA modification methylase
MNSTNDKLKEETPHFGNTLLGAVAVYNEDCKETMKRLQSNQIDLIVTSPPYFNAREYSQYNSVQDYMAQMKEIFLIAYDKLKESRMCVVNISPVLVEREKRSKQSYRIPLPFYFVPMMEEIGFEFLEDIIWVKPDGSAPNRNGGFYRHRKPVAYKPNIITEYVLVFKKPAPFLIDKVIKNNSLVEDGYERTNVWQINPDTSNWHPAPFPEALAEKIVKYYSYEGDLVYDCFAGSGTVGRVCQRLKRKSILSEIKTDYYTKMIEVNGW